MATELKRQLAERVKDELNGAAAGTFSQSFTAVRAYVPKWEPAELETLRVTVVGKSQRIRPAARGRSAYEVKIDVGVQKKVPSFDPADLDGWADFVDEIIRFLDLESFEDLNASFLEIENPITAEPDMLDRHNVFFALVTVTYRVVR